MGIYERMPVTPLDSAPKCIGSLLREDPLHARGNSLVPTVATLLTGAFSREASKGLVATHDHPVHGSGRAQAMASVNQANVR